MLIKAVYVGIILLTFTSLLHPLHAQIYTIHSFEGTAETVSFKIIKRGRVLSVSCSTDTLFLNDYTEGVHVDVLHDRFLKVIYGVRGGSGLIVKNIAVLLISKGKIRPALLFTAYAHSLSQESEVRSTVTVRLSGREGQGYKAVAAIREVKRSFKNPKENSMHSTQVPLRFDSVRKVFYNANAGMAEVISVCVPNNFNYKDTQLRVDETAPVIRLDTKEVYYYIAGMWYNKGYKDVFYSDYYW